MAAIVKKMWTENEVQKLDEMYKQGIGTRDIAAQLGRTQRSVMGKAHCLGLSHKARNDYLYTEKEDSFIIDNAKSMTRAAIGEAIGRSEGSVSRRGERLGIEFQRIGKTAQYTKNMDFFYRPNISNSHIAGWIASDGWIRPESGKKPINQVGISVAKKDLAILEYIKAVTEYTGVIREYVVGQYPQAELRISGVPQWLEDLDKYWNLTPNKTHTIQPPNVDFLSPEQILAYHVGLIEGDGYIRISNKTLMVSFVSASKPFSDWVAEIWKDVVGAEPSKYKHKTSKAYYVSVYGKNARNLCRELFKVQVHLLNRKWDVAIHEISRWEHRDTRDKT